MTRQFHICLILKLFLAIYNAQSNLDDVTKVYETNDLEWLHNGKIAVPTGIKNEVNWTLRASEM